MTDKLRHVTHASIVTSNQSTDTVTVIVKDSSKYSLRFIKSLQDFCCNKKIYLNDSCMILDDSLTYYFPKDPPLGREIHFSNKHYNFSIDLTVQRILFTTIKFNIVLTDSEGQKFTKSGVADLTQYFFMGYEMDEDTLGIGYASTEYYYFNSLNGEAIRIGINPENENQYLAKIISVIGRFDIGLDFPSLLEIK